MSDAAAVSPLDTRTGGSLHDEPILTWLDDQDSPAVRAWAAKQQRRTDAALDGSGLREASRELVRAIVDRERRELPETFGGATFQRRRAAGEQQSSVWVEDEAGERLLIDPATLDADGATAITMISASPDGRLLAWARAVGGSDWQSIRVREVSTGRDLPVELDWIKAPQAAWAPDGTGFSYLGFDQPDEGNVLVVANKRKQLRHHVVGTPVTADRVIFEHPTAHWLSVHAPAALGWIVVEVIDGTTTVEIRAATREAALEHGTSAFVTLVSGEAEVSYVGATAEEVIYCSFADNPDGEFFAVSPTTLARRRIALPPGPVDAWRSVATDGFLVAAYHSGHDVRLGWASLTDDRTGTFDVPDGLWVRLIDRVEGAGTLRIRLVGHAVGERDVELDVATGEWRVLRDTLQPERTRPERRRAVSVDGTEVPYVIVRGADDPGTSPRPTLLAAYGGYGADFLTYGFEEWHQAWLDLGGVVVLAGIRGGSEHGEAWHEVATRAGKQRSYDDVIAVAETIIDEGVTTREMLACNGMSNGGLMVGAVLTQRPDLWGATVPEVGVMDLLRFHEFTVGAGWIREFGDPREHVDRERLGGLSPLHRLEADVDYPPTLVVTADRDDRVVPGVHSYRFAERLQQLSGDLDRHLLRIEPDAGHAVGKSTATVVRERGDILTFLRMTIAAADAAVSPQKGH